MQSGNPQQQAVQDAIEHVEYQRFYSIGMVNWIGIWTLLLKEVNRFKKVWMQTLLAPMITTMLYFTVFAVALGDRIAARGGEDFLSFLAPGLMIMSMIQSAFANVSSSLIISKVQGNIVDLLMPPLNEVEFAVAFILGGVARGFIVGGATMVALFLLDTVLPGYSLFPNMPPFGVFYILFHGIFGCMFLALLGLASGIWADKFDNVATVTNFVITPLTFLSGTFYTLDRLPEAFQMVAHFNPFFYVIDGFRYGFIGMSDPSLAGSLGTGILVILGVNILLWGLVLSMLRSGYKLKP